MDDSKLCGAVCIVDSPLEGRLSSAWRRYAKLLPVKSQNAADFIRDGEYQLILMHKDIFRRNSCNQCNDATMPVLPDLRMKTAKYAFQLDALKRDLLDLMHQLLKANRIVEVNLHPFHCMSPEYLRKVRSDEKILDTNDCWYSRGFLITYRQKITTSVMDAGADAWNTLEHNTDTRASSASCLCNDDSACTPHKFRDQVDKVSGRHDFSVVLELRQMTSRDKVGEAGVYQTYRWTTSQPDTGCCCSYGDQQGPIEGCLLLQLIEMTADQLLSEVTTSSSSSSCRTLKDLLHPAFVDRRNNFVFHSLLEVRGVLVEAQKVYGGDVTPFNELLEHLESAEGDCRRVNCSDSLEVHQATSRPYPAFIVVEGLDATGKSTLVSRLAKQLGGCQLHSPPKSLMYLRDTFYNMPSTIRRAFNSLGNYLVGQTVKQLLISQQPVVLDRYWHSTAAYGIAEESSIPERDDHWVYRWPEDLVRPTVVILLVVSEQVRNERMKHRVATSCKKPSTGEIALRDNDDFRIRVLDSYRRMHNPGVIEVSAEGTPHQVLQRVTDVLRLKNVI